MNKFFIDFTNSKYKNLIEQEKRRDKTAYGDKDSNSENTFRKTRLLSYLQTFNIRHFQNERRDIFV